MNISLFKSQKGIYLPAGADVASGTDRRADVARGTTARMRRGVEATWQGRGWPTQGACGAPGADMWQEATRVHVVHADASVGCHVAGAVGSWRAHEYSGPWLGIGGGNANALPHPTI